MALPGTAQRSAPLLRAGWALIVNNLVVIVVLVMMKRRRDDLGVLQTHLLSASAPPPASPS
jgi:hypothetical protein